MKNELRTAAGMLAIMTLLTGAAYPLAVTAAARALFPFQADGSVIVRDGVPIGSALVGQAFSDPGYFHGRPSATSPVPYDAAASGGSNLGPLNPALKAAVADRVAALRAEDQGLAPVPADLVTASGSGLDPHVSPEAALAQARRVARARGVPETEARALVARHVEGRWLGLLGEPRVNVLLLNLALDEAFPRP